MGRSATEKKECIACFSESVAILHNEVHKRSFSWRQGLHWKCNDILKFLLKSRVCSLALACWGTEDSIIILTTLIISVSKQYDSS